MFRKLIIVVFVILSIALVGCSGGGETFDNFNPYTGYEGLRISFMRMAPPYEIVEGEMIPIGILIENKGAAEVNRGKLSIVYESDYMTPPTGENYDIVLHGKSVGVPDGGIEHKLFYSRSKPLDELSRTHDVQIIATACYEYQTTFSENICIDTDYFNVMGDKKPCTRTDIYGSSQGAPVAVTSVRQILNEDSHNVSFEITVENIAGGELIDYFAVDSICNNQGRYLKDSYNKVILNGRVSNYDLECKSDSIKLDDDGVGKFRCWYMDPDFTNGAYNTVININLRYGYLSTISTEINIVGIE